MFVVRSAAARRRVPSLVDVTLDPAQRAAIELPPDRPLLVLGEAGHGKTTVLVHRVARVWRSRPSMRAAVLVPTEGLVRLLVPVFRRFGIGVDVLTFDAFISKQGRRAYRRLPRESELTPPSVSRLKRAGALRTALDVLAERTPGVIDDDRDAAGDPRKRTRASVSRGDLQHLFGDRLLMESVAREAKLPAHAVEELLERTRVQFGARAEDEWSHVTDRERLVAVDRRALDDGTEAAHAWTVDVEDYPVLFELDRLRAARAGRKPKAPLAYDLLAIDEAQELAPLELALFGRSLAPDGTLVVSGDADQHTDETGVFGGWDSAMRELGKGACARVSLGIGYRCPPDVAELARAVRDGAPPKKTLVRSFADEDALVATIGPALGTLALRDRRAAVAILCRHPVTARRLYERLRGLVPNRLVFDGRFLPRGPVQITVTSEVKGLDLDYVVIPDANDRDYPDDAASRRSLYVALTRARHQVVIASVGVPTPILRCPPAAAASGSRGGRP
jgi:hypothetical protein